jgi:hypothetical protein
MKMTMLPAAAHQMYIPLLSLLYYDFYSSYALWLGSHPNISLTISPLLLNQRFALFADFAHQFRSVH